jgi:hypothetical protein
MEGLEEIEADSIVKAESVKAKTEERRENQNHMLEAGW